MHKRGPRNALYHLDERMLREIDREPNGIWLQDLGLSHTKGGFTTDEKKMLRVYIFREDRMIIMGEVLKLKPLRAEIDAIISSLGLTMSRPDK